MTPQEVQSDYVLLLREISDSFIASVQLLMNTKLILRTQVMRTEQVLTNALVLEYGVNHYVGRAGGVDHQSPCNKSMQNNRISQSRIEVM